MKEKRSKKRRPSLEEWEDWWAERLHPRVRKRHHAETGSREVVLNETLGIKASPEDADIMLLRWCLFQNGKGHKYAFVNGRINGGKFWITMHQVVAMRSTGAPIPEGFEVDHINHDTLDNRRENLRVCSHSENISNLKKSNSKSGFFGAYWKKRGGWQSTIMKDRKKICLGHFKTAEEAARAYDAAAERIGHLTRNFK